MGNKGFTLIEIMVALAISGIVMASIYTAFLSQHNNYLAQEQVAEMQQNIRAGVNLMTREIRMAGFDPNGDAKATISAATVGSISFSMDLNEDGDTDAGDAGENATYSLYTSDGVQKLGRTNQPVAENIEQLEFYYTLADGTQTIAPTASQLADIRNIQISILARAGRADRNFTNTMTYTPASGIPWDLNGATAGTAPNDNFRRRLLITTIQCRNMGL